MTPQIFAFVVMPTLMVAVALLGYGIIVITDRKPAARPRK